MNLYNETTLFEYLQLNHYPDLVKARKQMSKWDCYSPSELHRIELKCRGKHYDTLILERKKYDAMIEKCSDNDDLPIYINSTPEGIYRFNLYDVKPEWSVMKLRKTTQFDNKQKVPKEIALIPVIDAEIL